MAHETNSFERFWQELKRRKVFSVVTTYAATAYIIIEVVNNLIGPLNLPDWLATLVVILLIIGLPVAVIIAWIFDFTPQGIKKTESLEELERKEIITKPVKRKLRASYVLNAILIIAVIVLAYPKIFKQDTLERLRSSGERIFVAVMPFQNMTGDTTKNFWQEMIQDNLIASLSNSEELKVRQAESINALLKNNYTNIGLITPSFVSSISQKLNANVFVLGSINQMNKILRLNIKMVEPESEEVFKSFQIDGTDENIRYLIDSISIQVKNFLIISKLIKGNTPDIQKNTTTSIIPKAYKLFMDGRNEFSNHNFEEAINNYLQAVQIDSNFAAPYLRITWAYCLLGRYEESKKWCLMVIEKKNLMSQSEKIDADVLHSLLFETIDEVIGHLKRQLEFDDQQPIVYSDLGIFYNLLHHYDDAIPAFLKSLDIYNKWGKPFWEDTYGGLEDAYCKTGQYKKEKEILKKSEQYFPESPWIQIRRAALSLIERDTIAANNHIKKFISLRKEQSVSEGDIKTNIARIFAIHGLLDKAEEYYRQAFKLEAENLIRIDNLAYFLIDKDRDINEGLEIIEKVLTKSPDNFNYLHTKGWGLYKQEKYQEAMEILQRSWNLRMKNAVYNHEAYLHLEAANKAVASQKNN